jgi:hypothetical protein
MQRQTIFKSLAKHYDLLYSWKDYKKEVAAFREPTVFVERSALPASNARSYFPH